jgi:hypothetical protein
MTEEEKAAAAAAEAKAAAEKKAAEEKAAADKAAAEKAAADAAKLAAEKAADEALVKALVVPKDSLLDPNVTERVKALAKANGWTPEAAKAVLDAHHAEVSETLKVMEAANKKGGSLYEARVKEHAAKALADQELGNGDARELEAKTLRAQLVLNRLDPDGTVKALLEASGEGSNPEVLKMLNRVATLTGEKALAIGERGAPASKKPASFRDFYDKDGNPKEPLANVGAADGADE